MFKILSNIFSDIQFVRHVCRKVHHSLINVGQTVSFKENSRIWETLNLLTDADSIIIAMKRRKNFIKGFFSKCFF